MNNENTNSLEIKKPIEIGQNIQPENEKKKIFSHKNKINITKIGEVKPYPQLLKELMDDVYNTDPNKRKRDFLPTGIIGMVVGEGGSGKTFLLMQLALSIATGNIFLNRFEPIKPGRVLILLGEETKQTVTTRLQNLISELSDSTKDLINKNMDLFPLADKGHIKITDSKDPTKNTEFFKTLKTHIETQTTPYDLIILDPGVKFMGIGTETDNANGDMFIERLRELSKGNSTIIFAHHTGKNSSGSYSGRGSSSLTDGSRWVLLLSKVKSKNNGGNEFKVGTETIEKPTSEIIIPGYLWFQVIKNSYSDNQFKGLLKAREKGGGFDFFDKIYDNDWKDININKTNISNRYQKDKMDF